MQVIEFGAQRGEKRAREGVASRRAVELEDADVTGARSWEIGDADQRPGVGGCGVETAEGGQAQ